MPADASSLILQLYARTPSPCRDYCGLTITRNEIILNIWNITYGPHIYPKRFRCPLNRFENDKHMQTEVIRLFGEHVFKYTTTLSLDQKRLENLPSKLFLKILNCLAARDIVHLSQTSKILFELCNTENTWKMLFNKYFRRRPGPQDIISAERFGWKETLRHRIQTRKEHPISLSMSRTTMSQRSFQSSLGDKANNKINTISKSINNKKVADNTKNPIKKEIKASSQDITLKQTLKIVQNLDDLEGKLLIATPKIDQIRSSCALIAKNNKNQAKTINRTKSVAQLGNSTKNIKLQQKPKSEVKVKNINNLLTLKHADVKIEVPLELQNSIACMKNNCNYDKNLHKALSNKAEVFKPSLPTPKRNSAVLKK